MTIKLSFTFSLAFFWQEKKMESTWGDRGEGGGCQ